MTEPKNRRFIVLDVNKLEAREEVLEDGSFLDFAYKTIGCSLVEVSRVGKRVDLWCDEEGMLKEPKRFVSWYDQDGEKRLAGTVIIAEHDSEGETLGTRLPLDGVKDLFFFVIKP